MIKYILGWIKNFFNSAVSLLALVDCYSYINKKAKIHANVKFFHSSIDSYSYICSNTTVVHATIGKYCSIASNCCIGLGTHTLQNLSTSPIFTEKYNAIGKSWTKISVENPYKRVEIGNDVWIGNSVIIMGGIKVGDGAIIGAGAIVTKDVPPYSIVVGIPAKVIRFRFENIIREQLLLLKWWNLPEELIKSHIDLFQSNEINSDLIKVFK